jgi:hypothetical protein
MRMIREFHGGGYVLQIMFTGNSYVVKGPTGSNIYICINIYIYIYICLNIYICVCVSLYIYISCHEMRHRFHDEVIADRSKAWGPTLAK